LIAAKGTTRRSGMPPNHKPKLRSTRPCFQIPELVLQQAHDRAEIPGTVQTANPGHHTQSQRRLHHDDNGRVGLMLRADEEIE
jgi:hypothetical protein